MTHEQENYVAALARTGERVHVTQPYTDGSVEVTPEHGKTVLVHENGRIEPRPRNQSINWSE